MSTEVIVHEDRHQVAEILEDSSHSAADPGYVRECEESVGVITGINHMQLIVRDMRESVPFYRDLLGLKLVRTYGRFSLKDFPEVPPAERNYYFDMGNGELLLLLEIPTAAPPNPSGFTTLWPGNVRPSPEPSKLDHIAFNVDTRERLDWFRQRLIAAAVPVSDIVFAGGPKMTTSIYFYDPSGNPLEIATCDGPESSDARGQDWLDDRPVPEILR